jgi:type II secretion system protein H
VQSSISNRRPATAFTLMELMVVIVLISIMTALIIPEMKGTYEDALLRSTGRELAGVLSLASSRAVSQNQAHYVLWDAKTGRYQVACRRPIGGHEEMVPLRDVAGGEGKLDTRITIHILPTSEMGAPAEAAAPGEARLDRDSIGFFPDGTAEAVEIQLRDRAGFQLVMQLNPVTARIRLSEPLHE